MRIAITGVAGFLGSSLARRALSQGVEVFGCDNFSPYYAEKLKLRNLEPLLAQGGFSFEKGDLCDEAFLDHWLQSAGAIDSLFHFAATPGVRSSIKLSPHYYQNNVVNTSTLMLSASRSKVNHFVLASSSSVYGSADGAVAETGAIVPLSPYAATKACAEILVRSESVRTGIPCTILRFFTVYGPGQRPDMAFTKFFKACARGTEVDLTQDFESARDYTYVDDIVSGCLLSAESPDGIRDFNLGAGSPIQLGRVLSYIEALSGSNLRIRVLPPASIEPKVTHADICKAKMVLGFVAKTPVQIGLERQFNYMREAGDL